MLTVERVLELLEDRFKNELPTTTITMEELNKKIGNQEVIVYIKAIMEQDDYNNRKNKR